MTTMHSDAPPTKLTGKRALVTGGTRGIGAAIVRQLLQAGAEVLTTARSASSDAPDGASFVLADMQSRAGVEALAEAAQDRLGGVDLLVHNVGGAQPYKGASDLTDEIWQTALEINFLSAVRLDRC